MQVENIKEVVKSLQDLKLPLDLDYLIIKSDGYELGWGPILKTKPYKYSNKSEEQICRDSSGQYTGKGLTSSIDQEILAVIRH